MPLTLLDRIAPQRPDNRLLWEAVVDIADSKDLGHGPLGDRRIVPILGGAFRGGPGMEVFRGTVLAGGADRQLIRRDGIKELDALYEMEVEDGTVLTIRNRAVIDENTTPRYALSRIEVVAPDGSWSMLNRRLILGTVQSCRPERAAVIIRAWEMSPARTA